MRVCYVSADRGIVLSKHNGATAHLRSLVAAMGALADDLVVVTPEANRGLDADVVAIPTPDVLAELTAATEDDRDRKRVRDALGQVWNNVALEQTLGRVIADFRPDLVFEIYSPYTAAGVVAARRHGIPHVLNVHAPLAWEGQIYRRQALQEAAEELERFVFASAPVIVTQTTELRDQLLADGVEEDKVAVVPNGVDVDVFAPGGPSRAPDFAGKVVVGFVSSLKAWHGVELLVDAFREAASDPRLHLLVVGDGPMRRPLRKLADELPGRVTLTGAVPLEDVPAYVRAMDIALAPYPTLERFYFSPLKVLESMAAGRAVIASAIGQLNELIDDGRTGLLVAPGDAHALAVAVRELADDPGRRERLGRAAAEEARSEHTWERRAREILDLAGALA